MASMAFRAALAYVSLMPAGPFAGGPDSRGDGRFGDDASREPGEQRGAVRGPVGETGPAGPQPRRRRRGHQSAE